MNNGDSRTSFYRILMSRLGYRRSRHGQTLVEYALILAVISIVAVGVMINLGQKIGGVYSTITSVITSAAASH